ncbi:hypothetical protein QLQ12_33295 [Actinoplanes sp. NEAU-A12]|uniref:DUF5642 domain-containing protein n=1 Tax=Actinoplanes sandaracinus TaxID=3045177 RepID=A0ABT6WUS7_9ACTN|nr:hypothetical protein [Actinoplanes sandaracinus]MDI6103497.1 hypothetical protein [Actinoplanes sandaracinus]
MRHAGETPGGPAGAPGDDGEVGGLGARLVALGGLELGEFDAVPAGPDGRRDGGAGSGRTAENEAAPRRRALVISAVVAVAVLGFFGTAAYLFVNIGGTSPAASPPLPPRKPSASATEGGVAAGPRAAGHGVRGEEDLHRVCEDWFYPSAPKFRGEGPNPVVISERAAPEAEYRTVRTLNQAAFSGPAAQRRTWAPEPAQARLVVCLDVIGAGKPIRDCASGSKTLPLVEGRYRMTVYEVATHRKVAEKDLTGADRACPFVILSSAGNQLHSAVKDRQLLDLLRESVEG